MITRDILTELKKRDEIGKKEFKGLPFEEPKIVSGRCPDCDIEIGISVSAHKTPWGTFGGTRIFCSEDGRCFTIKEYYPNEIFWDETYYRTNLTSVEAVKQMFGSLIEKIDRNNYIAEQLRAGYASILKTKKEITVGSKTFFAGNWDYYQLVKGKRGCIWCLNNVLAVLVLEVPDIVDWGI